MPTTTSTTIELDNGIRFTITTGSDIVGRVILNILGTDGYSVGGILTADDVNALIEELNATYEAIPLT